MENSEKFLEMEKSLMQLNGTTEKLQNDISTVIDLFKGTLAPKRTIDELVLQTQYFHFPSYGYPFNYLFVSDADAGATLIIGDKSREHAITLVGGWNTINAIDGWWKCSKNMNVILLRSKDSIFPGSNNASSNPFFTSSILTGNLPPLDPVTPKLIATIPYSDFTVASSNINPYYAGVLTRSARERTFMVYNDLNEALTTCAFNFYDTILGISGQPQLNGLASLSTPPGVGQVSIGTSEETTSGTEGLLASHVDSFQAALGIGATLPTSGNVYIYVSELL